MLLEETFSLFLVLSYYFLFRLILRLPLKLFYVHFILFLNFLVFSSSFHFSYSLRIHLLLLCIVLFLFLPHFLSFLGLLLDLLHLLFLLFILFYFRLRLLPIFILLSFLFLLFLHHHLFLLFHFSLPLISISTFSYPPPSPLILSSLPTPSSLLLFVLFYSPSSFSFLSLSFSRFLSFSSHSITSSSFYFSFPSVSISTLSCLPSLFFPSPSLPVPSYFISPVFYSSSFVSFSTSSYSFNTVPPLFSFFLLSFSRLLFFSHLPFHIPFHFFLPTLILCFLHLFPNLHSIYFSTFFSLPAPVSPLLSHSFLSSASSPNPPFIFYHRIIVILLWSAPFCVRALKGMRYRAGSRMLTYSSRRISSGMNSWDYDMKSRDTLYVEGGRGLLWGDVLCQQSLISFALTKCEFRIIWITSPTLSGLLGFFKVSWTFYHANDFLLWNL
jgi:hypothetical protein